MTLTEKVIKNTSYYLLAQISTFVFPLLLTPFIISKIGQIQFGIYAIVLGFTGTIGLFDLSLSNSFIKFISEYYNKKQYERLNGIINTGLIFYILFSLIFCTLGVILSKPLLSILNIPDSLFDLSVYAFRISLLIFFISTSFGIFGSVLISLQKMYITSIFGLFTGLLNFASVILLLSLGFGLEGILYSQLGAVIVNIITGFTFARKYLPEMKISPANFSFGALKKMTGFGIQMQLSKLAMFASEKYDEFLLGFFSVMNNVAFFNISSRIVRFGRLVPFQLVPQVAPIAAELNAKEEKAKLKQLFSDTTKYLTLISVPVFVYIFVFADVIITSWMGPGYEISAYLLRILALGQLLNMVLSAPGNSITPNIGIPKYQMNEGLISLLLNLILSYFLIKNYGIIGAAIGNSAAVSIASVYVYFVSSKYFKEKRIAFFKSLYLKPVISAVIISAVLFIFSLILQNYFPAGTGRKHAITYLAVSGFIFLISYSGWILNFNYLNKRDKEVFVKILIKLLPVNYLLKRKNRKYEEHLRRGEGYQNELMSFFIITYNRLDFLKKCLNSLLGTINNINYEIIIWDNNSSDGTKEYLNSLNNERIKTVLHDRNIGVNAKGLAAELCSGDYLIGIDDDVIEFPDGWVQKMVYAYKNIPGIGYLATDVVQDEYTNGAKYPDEYYTEKSFDKGNIKLLSGPTGGWCFMLSRNIYNIGGKLPLRKNRFFYGEDGEYVNRLMIKGYLYGILKGVKVYHATGEKLNLPYKDINEAKLKDYFRKDIPLFVKLKEKLSVLLNIRRYYYKFLEHAENEIKKGD